MNKLTVKKLAAIAAGVALVGSAIAPMASAVVAKADVYSDDGSPAVNVVVGSGPNVAVTDIVWAGNIAAAVARNAVTAGTVVASGGGACGAWGAPSGIEVNLSVGGTKTVTGAKTWKITNFTSASGTTAEENDQNIGSANLPHLYNKSVSFKYANTTYTTTMQEKIGVTADPLFDYTHSAIQDLMLKVGTAGDLKYIVDLGTGIPYHESGSGAVLSTTTATFTDGSEDNIKIPFWGDEYLVKTLSRSNTSGASYIELIKSKAEQLYDEGDKIPDLEGKGTYAGQQFYVIVGSGGVKDSNSVVTLTLYDANGNQVDTGSYQKGDVTFYDANDKEVLESAVNISSILSQTIENTNYYKPYILTGTNRILLYDTKGYPYDSSAVAPYDWVAQFRWNITRTDYNTLTELQVKNSKVLWDDTNPIYSTVAEQNLNPDHKAGQTSVKLPEDYAELEFQGFETDEALSTAEIGDTLGDGTNRRGIEFADASDIKHYVPFYIKLSAATSWSSFTYDSKTIYYIVDKTDTNLSVCDGNLLNGVPTSFNEIVTAYGRSGATLAAQHFKQKYVSDTNSPLSLPLHVADYNVTGATVQSNGNGGVYGGGMVKCDTNKGVTLVFDGNVQFRKDNSTGDIIKPLVGTKFVNNSLYYDDGNIMDSNGSFGGISPVTLTGSNDIDVNYAFMVSETYNQLWLLLADQILGTTASDTTTPGQYDTRVNFLGTNVDENAIYTSKGPNSYPFYLPDSLEFGASALLGKTATKTGGDLTLAVPSPGAVGATSSDNNYFTAIFAISDGNVSTDTADDINVYVDTAQDQLVTLPNNNLSNPSYQAYYYNGVDGLSYSLRADSPASYMSVGYNDFGAKFTVADNVFTAKIPENKPDVVVVLKGSGSVEEVTGGDPLTIAKGASGTTDAGTKITINDVTYADGTCGAAADTVACTATPSEYETVSTGYGNLVVTDASPGTGRHIIVGGWKVNTLANAIASSLKDSLKAAGDKVVDVVEPDGDIVVAGYTANDTVAAAKALIAVLDA